MKKKNEGRASRLVNEKNQLRKIMLESLDEILVPPPSVHAHWGGPCRRRRQVVYIPTVGTNVITVIISVALAGHFSDAN